MEKVKKLKKRNYQVTISFDLDTDNIQTGKEVVKKAIEFMGLKVTSVKYVSEFRSDSQNNSLHLWLDQIAQEAQKQGLTIDKWVRVPTEMFITEGMLKDSFRATGKAMFKKKSTADLTREEFSMVQKLFDKAVLERLGIDIPFPNLDLLIDQDLNNQNNK